MPTPRTFLGTRDTNALLALDTGYEDRSEPYDLDAKTNRYAPAGEAGECIFTSLYVVLSYTRSITVYITPYVDGTALETQSIALVQNGSVTRQTVSRELGLSVPVTINGVERARVSPRGTWCQCRVETRFAVGGIATDVDIEGLWIEYEVVRESKMPGVA